VSSGFSATGELRVVTVTTKLSRVAEHPSYLRNCFEQNGYSHY